MKALVVYDSEFGNTEKIAKVIGETLGCDVLRPAQMKQEFLNDLDVLVVGSPTQAFQPLKPIKDFLDGLNSDALKGVKVAAFDTRADIEKVNNRFLTVLVKLFGYADKPIARKLTKKGGTLALQSNGFVVNEKEGPLKEGELERAAAWIKGLESK